MKKKFFNLAILPLFTFFFSCEKEPLDIGVEPITPITQEEIREPFEVVFDNTRYISTNVEAFVVSDGISINAQNNQIGTFLISIQGNVEQREYTNNELTMLYISSSGDTYSTQIGEKSESTLTITLIDYQKRRVSGTFSFVGTKLVNGSPTQETKDFSNGKFYNVTTYGSLVNP